MVGGRVGSDVRGWFRRFRRTSLVVTVFSLGSLETVSCFSTTVGRFCQHGRWGGVLSCSQHSQNHQRCVRTRTVHRAIRPELENKLQSDTLVRAADPNEISNITDILADGFLDERRRGTWVGALERKFLQFNLYVGMLDRLFMASFNEGLMLGDTRSEPKTHVHNFLVAYDKSGELVGSAEITMKSYPCRANRIRDKVPYICNVVVRKEWRRRGYGNALVLACEEKAREAGLDEIFLDTKSDNAAALRLYQTLGYVAEVVDPSYRSPRKVYMRKRLAASAPKLKPDALSMQRIIRKDVEVDGAGSEVVWVPVLSDEEMYLPPSSKLEVALGPFAPFATAVLAAFAWLLF